VLIVPYVLVAAVIVCWIKMDYVLIVGIGVRVLKFEDE